MVCAPTLVRVSVRLTIWGGAPCNTKAVQAGDCPSPNDIQVSPDSSHPTWKSSGQTIWSPRSTKPQKRVRYLQFVRAADDAPSTNLGRQLAVGFQYVNVLLREVRHLRDNLILVSYWLSWRSRPNCHFQQFQTKIYATTKICSDLNSRVKEKEHTRR